MVARPITPSALVWFGSVAARFTASPMIVYSSRPSCPSTPQVTVPASRPTPTLRVLRAETLSVQLEVAAHACVAAEVEARPAHGDLPLPLIFKWHQGDFGGRRGVIAFVVARLDDAQVTQ